MGFRFSKRIKVCPGVTLNLSKSGISTSVGIRGASVNFNKNGVRTTVGIPGSGLSYSNQFGYSQKPKPAGQVGTVQLTPTSCEISEDGYFFFLDQDGNRFSATENNKLKKQYENFVEEYLNDYCMKFNKCSEDIMNLGKDIVHLQNSPLIQEKFKKNFSYNLAEPIAPDYSLIQKEVEQDLRSKNASSLFFNKKVKNKTDEVYAELMKDYNTALLKYRLDYDKSKSEFDMLENNRILQYKQIIEPYFNLSASDDVLKAKAIFEDAISYVIDSLDFPLPTFISFEVIDTETLFLDIDLPEIEDIPLYQATVTSSGKISKKKISQKNAQELYANVVCATAFKLSSILFNCFPKCSCIIASGYTQRLNPRTGLVSDDYIYSIEVDKSIFASIDFSKVDFIKCMDNFEPLMKIKSNYYFEKIMPYSVC